MLASVLIVGCAILGNDGETRLTPGNLMTVSHDQIREYNRSGQFVQRVVESVEYPGGTDSDPTARDLVVDRDLNIQVFNGAFDPYLSSFSFDTRLWSHQSFPGWSLFNNGSYGGLATKGRYVYMPDMRTFGNPEDAVTGIVRFDLNGGPTIRFAEDIEPFDLNVGLDGLLYAMYPGGSPSGRTVRVFNPETLAIVKTIDVSQGAGWQDLRGIAADYDGSLFIVAYDERIFHLTPDGAEVIKSLALPTNDTSDIDIAPDGGVVVGGRSGTVVVTDRSLESLLTFQVGDENVWVTFVVPEPSSLALLSLGIVAAWPAVWALRSARPGTTQRCPVGE